LTTDDIIGGFIKSTVFAFIIGVVACRQGLRTEGGTVGVGRSTTTAVVSASILVIVADYFITRLLQIFIGLPT
jgi:phospholipid/cholesterol/gamma-HCH transport system permease protein